MADSQNTYQNDVKVSGNHFDGIVKAILAVAVAFLLGFSGYSFYTDAVENAYDKGYEIAYDEGYEEGYKVAYNKVKTESYNNGYTKGYNEGFDDGKKEGYNEGVVDGANKAKNSTSSNQKASSSSNSNSNEKSYNYILNSNTKKFHRPNCRSVTASPEDGGMKEKNKVYFGGTRSQAINNGYSPCKNCNP